MSLCMSLFARGKVPPGRAAVRLEHACARTLPGHHICAPGQWGEALERASWGQAVLLWGPVTRQDTEGVGSICPISRHTTAWLWPRRHGRACPGTLKPASQDCWLTSALAWSLSRWPVEKQPPWSLACSSMRACSVASLVSVSLRPCGL